MGNWDRLHKKLKTEILLIHCTSCLFLSLNDSLVECILESLEFFNETNPFLKYQNVKTLNQLVRDSNFQLKKKLSSFRQKRKFCIFLNAI
jgi:hypothetical protein